MPGTYDDAVREASRQAATNGWFIVSDTSWRGYTEVPRQIMQGYRLMADEAADQWDGGPPTHVFVQGWRRRCRCGCGFGADARAVPSRYPSLVVVEPDRAACLLASAELGQRATVPGNLDTLMAGLACGEPSVVAWQELDQAAAAFMAIPDAGGGCLHAAARRVRHCRGRVGRRRACGLSCWPPPIPRRARCSGWMHRAGCWRSTPRALPTRRCMNGWWEFIRVWSEPGRYAHVTAAARCVMLAGTFMISSGCHSPLPLTGHPWVCNRQL